MGGIQLCKFTKGTYAFGGFMYMIGCILDIISVFFWFTLADNWDEVVRDDDDDIDGWDGNVRWAALPPALGALAFLVGCVYSFLAVRNWQVSGAPDARGTDVPAGGAQATGWL
eukprot:g18625.t1